MSTASLVHRTLRASLVACALLPLVPGAAEMSTSASSIEKPSASASSAATPVATPATPATATFSTVVSNYAARPEVLMWLEELSKAKALPMAWLTDVVAVARYSPLSEKYTTPRPKAPRTTTPEKNFRLYAKNLVNSERIKRGVKFLNAHREVFDRVEASSGVPRYIVAAIIGIESIYGRNMGRFRVLDALMTLSFDYTRRADYYRTELANFLEFCWNEHIEPVSVTGSFAGAMGLGQFMPASLRAWGMDGDGDGRIDIVESEADGIASVANFLVGHGWVRGVAPLYRVKANDEIFRATKSGGIRAHTTVAELLQAGVEPFEDIPLPAEEPALLVDLPWTSAAGKHATDYFIGTRSFSAILRYNRSYFYAAAVTRLAEELEKRVPVAVAEDQKMSQKQDATEDNTVSLSAPNK